KVPGGAGQVVKDPDGEQWGVVLENPSLHQVLAELKVMRALCDSGLLEAFDLGGSDPTLHVVVPPERLADVPSAPSVKRWCRTADHTFAVAD
ncbi:MAG: hypothetical protein VX104_00610, partial [Planctomycetota bacterium]|nr:hypothetical protein [Planctomycetota bacterium]